jgi:type II secretory pathway component PulC
MSSLSSRYLNVIVIVGLIAAATALGSSLLKFSHLIHEAAKGDNNPYNASRSVAVTLPDVASVAKMGWFGHAPEEQASSGASDVNTLSQLELMGVSQSDHPALAGAFIAEKGQPESYYHIGDTLPGEAGVLEEVFADHVTVRRGQVINTLSFPDANEEEP